MAGDCSSGTVLIETLWNVKLSVRYENAYEVIVLIETLWNVKRRVDYMQFIPENRINRNIVECKDESERLLRIQTQDVLIETLWNVKVNVCAPVNQ